MAWRRWQILVLLTAAAAALPGCAQWGSWFSAGKATPGAPPSLAPPAPSAQFGVKPGLFGIKALAWHPQPPTDPPPKPKTPEQVRESQVAYARLCERRGDNQQAEDVYRAMVQKYPQDPLPPHRLAVLAVQKGKFDAAEEHFRAAQNLGPPSADLLSDLGYTYYLQHRLPEAETTLRQALAKEPQHQGAMNNLALVVGAQGRLDEAMALFRRTCTEAQAYSNLAYVLSQSGDLKRAQDAYLCSLTLDNTLRPTAQAVLQVSQRRQAQEQLAARQTQPQDRPDSPETNHPAAAEKENALVSVTEGRLTPDADRRTARPAEKKPTLVQSRPTPGADRPLAASPRAAPAVEDTAVLRRPVRAARTPGATQPETEKETPSSPADRQPLSAGQDPAEPDVDEVQIAETNGRRPNRLVRPLPAAQVSAEDRPGSVQKTSFDSAMAELEAALSKPGVNRPAKTALPSATDSRDP